MATLKVQTQKNPKLMVVVGIFSTKHTAQWHSKMIVCHRAVVFSISQTSKKTIRQENAEEEELRIQRSSTGLPQSKVCHRAVISAISQTSKKTLDRKMKQKKESSGFEEAQLFLTVMFVTELCAFCHLPN
jgi:hypothetical protein